jgi:hypothetical protein
LTPAWINWLASGEGPLNRSGSPDSGVVFTPSAPMPSFWSVPWKLGSTPNTPIDPVMVDGSA